MLQKYFWLFCLGSFGFSSTAGEFKFYLRYDCTMAVEYSCDEACEKQAMDNCFAASKQWLRVGLNNVCVVDKRQSADSCRVQPTKAPHETPFVVYCKIKTSNCAEITDYGCLKGFSEQPTPYPSGTLRNLYGHVSADICVAPIPTKTDKGSSARND
jgi:hypothetical protein